MIATPKEAMTEPQPGDPVSASLIAGLVREVQSIKVAIGLDGKGHTGEAGGVGSGRNRSKSNLVQIRPTVSINQYDVVCAANHETGDQELLNGEPVFECNDQFEEIGSVFIAQSDIAANTVGYALSPRHNEPFIVRYIRGPLDTNGVYGQSIGPKKNVTGMSLIGFGFKFLSQADSDMSSDLCWASMETPHFQEVVCRLSETIQIGSSGNAKVIEGEIDNPNDTGHNITVYNYFYTNVGINKVCVARLLRTVDTTPKLVITEVLAATPDTQLVEVYDGQPIVNRNSKCVFPARIVQYSDDAQTGMCNPIKTPGAPIWLWLPNDSGITQLDSLSTMLGLRHIDSLDVNGDVRPMYAAGVPASLGLSLVEIDSDTLGDDLVFLGDDSTFLSITNRLGPLIDEAAFLTANTTIRNPSQLFFEGGIITALAKSTGATTYEAVILNVEHERAPLTTYLEWDVDGANAQLRHKNPEYPVPSQGVVDDPYTELFSAIEQTLDHWDGSKFVGYEGFFIEAINIGTTLLPEDQAVVGDWYVDVANKEIVEEIVSVKVLSASNVGEQRTATFECP